MLVKGVSIGPPLFPMPRYRYLYSMEPILLLHGALGAQSQLEPLAAALGSHYQVQLFNFTGHGGRPLPAEGLAMQRFADELRDFIQVNGLQRPAIFGYSMGGYAAMLACRQQPELFGRLITLATKYHWDEPTAEKEVKMLDPATVQAKLPAFAETLAQRHAPHQWQALMVATAGMLRQLGQQPPLAPEDFAAIPHPSLLMLGDRDKMVTLEETYQTYRQLPQAQMAVLPNTSHPLEQVDVPLLAGMVQRFIG
jgi:pimeloyl-ACP methyl ester carboxylesterase